MNTSDLCPPRYEAINGVCNHFIWPPTMWILFGTLLLGFTNSLATLAGVGGGSIALVILMSLFEYLPKDASLVVFSCVLGASAGNTFNLLSKAFNGKPLIQYKYAFVSIPLMFTGSFLGVVMNKLFPSIITYSIIIIVFFVSMNKTFTRFITEFKKESEQIKEHQGSVTDLHAETSVNPLEDQRNVYIFKNLGFLMLITITLSFLRGSSKFPSIIGLAPCSFLYWLLFVISFLITIVYAYRNMQILKTWYTSNKNGINSEVLIAKEEDFESHIKEVLQMSIAAGIFSGFGLGGGIFLVPMYRNLGCKPLEATATCAFGIFITSFINCIQAVAIGAIQFSEFLYFVFFLGTVGYLASKLISSELRKRNRFSLVEGALLALTILAIINIPISLYNRYADSGYNLKVLFGFGSFC